jgi:hypothetical protein
VGGQRVNMYKLAHSLVVEAVGVVTAGGGVDRNGQLRDKEVLALHVLTYLGLTKCGGGYLLLGPARADQSRPGV